ncbi:Dyp-type peroxidase [Streptomyces sp. NPDC002547]
MTEESSPALEREWSGDGCPAGPFARRSFLHAAAAGLAGATAGTALGDREAQADTPVAVAARAGAVPFEGRHQAGIATPPQQDAIFLSCDVTADDSDGLTDLFRTLTDRARFLTAGGTPPKVPPDSVPSDNGIVGPTVEPDNLTLTLSLGASLFDDRYGLASRKPVQLVTMQPFIHDELNSSICHGDLLIQICADHRDTTVHAMVDILNSTKGAMKLRWRLDGLRNPPRHDRVRRDWFGFKHGITNPDTADTGRMDQVVWTQPKSAEPDWAAGGTYHVVRIVHFFIDAWQKVPVAQQERILGRRKVSGAPVYATSDDASDRIVPVYTNDPQGLLTPINSHIRLANPQTPETAATSAVLRRGYDYDHGLDARELDLGHAFVSFQRELNTYIAMQTRLEAEALVPYISPRGGGYFFAVPGVRDEHDYFASGLLT